MKTLKATEVLDIDGKTCGLILPTCIEKRLRPTTVTVIFAEVVAVDATAMERSSVALLASQPLLALRGSSSVPIYLHTNKSSKEKAKMMVLSIESLAILA